MFSRKELLNYYFKGEGDRENYESSELLWWAGSPHQALLYTPLFIPDTAVIEGVVFLSELFTDPDKDFKAQRTDALRVLANATDDDWKRVVDSFNWIDLAGAMQARFVPGLESDDYWDDLNDVLIEMLVPTWQAILSSRYPQHGIVVRLIPDEETCSGPGIGFTQERPKK